MCSRRSVEPVTRRVLISAYSPDNNRSAIADEPTWLQSFWSVLLSQRTWQVLVWPWHQTARNKSKISHRNYRQNRSKQTERANSASHKPAMGSIPPQKTAKKRQKKKRQRKTKSRMPYLAAAGQQCWGQWSCSESSCRSEQFPGPKPQWRRWQRRWRRIAFSKLFWLTNKFTRVSRRMIKR